MNKCLTCDVEIKYVIHMTTGNPAPLELEPNVAGNLFITPAGTYEVITGDRLDAYRHAGVPLYLNHFATCPGADEYRQPTLAEAMAAGREGQAAAWDGTPEEWKTYAIATFKGYLETHQELFCDWVNPTILLPEGKDGRALGYLYPMAQKERWMARKSRKHPEGRTEASRSNHGGHKPVWWSLLYQPITDSDSL